MDEWNSAEPESTCGTQFSSLAVVNYKCDKWLSIRKMWFDWAIDFRSFFLFLFSISSRWKRERERERGEDGEDGEDEREEEEETEEEEEEEQWGRRGRSWLLGDYSSNMCCDPVIEFKSPSCICATAEILIIASPLRVASSLSGRKKRNTDGREKRNRWRKQGRGTRSNWKRQQRNKVVISCLLKPSIKQLQTATGFSC